MKIVIATDNYPPRYDGISRFLQEIIPSLARKHDVSVIAPDFGPTKQKWVVHKIPVLRMRIGDFHPAGLHFIKIYRRIKKADVVFLQTLGSIGMLALIAAKLRRKKVLLYTHSVEWEIVPTAVRRNSLRRTLPSIVKGINRIVYKWIHLLVMPAQSVSENYYWNKIDTKRVVVHLGVDTKKFVPPKNKKKAKRDIGIPDDAFVVGYHGRLAREKDLKTWLRGFLRFKRSHPELNAHALIVGDGLRSIRDIFNRDDATVTGFQEDVVPYLQAMDVYVMSSVTETSCLSVMEAMSCKLSVISTPVGFVKDYIQESKNGLFFPEKDSVMLAKHLSSLTDARYRSKLGRAAQKTMEEQFSWKTTRREINKVFDNL